MRAKIQSEALKQKQLRSRVHEFFTKEDPYYKDMLDMVAKQNEEIMLRNERLEMLKLEEGEIDKTYGVNTVKFINMRKRAANVQRRRLEHAENERKRKYLLLFKWMILAEIKGEKLDEKINEYRKAAALQRLVKIIKAIPVYMQMLKVIEERKLFFRR